MIARGGTPPATFGNLSPTGRWDEAAARRAVSLAAGEGPRRAARGDSSSPRGGDNRQVVSFLCPRHPLCRSDWSEPRHTHPLRPPHACAATWSPPNLSRPMRYATPARRVPHSDSPECLCAAEGRLADRPVADPCHNAVHRSMKSRAETMQSTTMASARPPNKRHPRLESYSSGGAGFRTSGEDGGGAVLDSEACEVA